MLEDSLYRLKNRRTIILVQSSEDLLLSFPKHYQGLKAISNWGTYIRVHKQLQYTSSNQTWFSWSGSSSVHYLVGSQQWAHSIAYVKEAYNPENWRFSNFLFSFGCFGAILYLSSIPFRVTSNLFAWCKGGARSVFFEALPSHACRDYRNVLLTSRSPTWLSTQILKKNSSLQVKFNAWPMSMEHKIPC